MCGIISIYEKENLKFNPDYLYKMADKLKYRGPDEISFYNNSPVLIAHTRLSIIDLNTGSQPIFNEDKSILCILNGEIYNYKELRKKLINKKHVFVSNSDTEVIVHLYEEYGNDFFVHLNGMFAIALYDINNDIMLIGRDRMGEKPVIYYEDEKFFIFASEIKSLLSSGLIEKKINYEALSLYMNSLYVPAPLTIIDKCKKLQPASYIKIQNKVLSLHKYWNPNVIIDRKSSEEDFCQIFNEIFNDAVKIRLEADVPLGIFLSGGIDSSAVAAYAAMQSKNKVKTFCVGFSDNMDERPYAKLVSEQFKTNHFEIFVGSLTSDDIINSLEYYDEPFADSSSVPSYFISKEARKHVKVILTGDGGDEFFSGYNYYVKNKYNFSNKYFNYFIKKINNTSINNFQIDLYKYIYNKINKKKFILSNFSRSYFNIHEIKALLKI
jgi:asparagine synthase (glutamine-hydrolysing)